ncbi:MAG: glycosyltransferase family 4 protein [Hyphomicrobiaceae bacterium]|nr:MAG: glycosyltransferase family 4 protein [Hyphomicrobiaceae bacterium]
MGAASRPVRRRLAIFTTHPIQYQAPWFRALAATADIDARVFFSYVPDAAEQGVGFGRAVTWDIPLRDGYANEVLPSCMAPSLVPGFARRLVGGIGSALDGFAPHAAMILGWQEFSLIEAMVACRRRGLPIILRGESNALRERPWYVSALHRRYFRQFDAFMAIGKANAELYRRCGIAKERIVTAGYFVDNDRFKASAEALVEQRDAIRKAWGILPGATVFVFVGKLEPKKCVIHFLEALRAAAGGQGERVHGLVVGTGAQMPEAKSYVEDHRLAVTFAGFMNQREIARAYVAADALVLPSDFGETWGLVVNEAMATGLPAIVSDRVGAANDLVIDGKTGIVFPFGSRSHLADVIVRLASCPEERLRMGAAARAHVQSSYSIARAVEATREAIGIAMRGRPRDRH